MAKHLIIGLGGTGGNVICELRKRIYECHHNNEHYADDVFVDFLYVDSSKEDLLGIDKEGKHLIAFKKKWSTQGHSIALRAEQTLFIGGLESEKIANLYKYNNLNSFYTEQDKEDTARGMGQIIGAGIGGQRRRFGRMLFSNNSTGENSFNARINNRMESLRQEGKKHGDNSGNVTFHICAGLGGGTGSGTIIDAISQIRHMYSQDGNEDQYRICLYLYVPEAIKNLERDKEGFYRPNGYAALSELNALSVGAYHPIDITDKREIDKEEKRLKDAGFEAAYIYTNRNFVGNQYGLDELSKIAADFLFQKLFAGISARFESNENVGASPEEINKIPVHSRKFLSFGIKRLIYPAIEIQEYASYEYSYVAAMQMVYGWPKGAQYPVAIPYDNVDVSPNEVRGTDDNHPMRQTLHLTDRMLRVDSEFFNKYKDLASKAKWSSFAQYWDGMAKRLYAQIIDRIDSKDLWTSKFNQEIMKLYTNAFRGNGVDNFFTNCQSDKKFLAAEVADHIGNYLLDEWKLGNKSLMQIEKFLDILIEDCRQRYERYDNDIANAAKLAQKYNKEANSIQDDFLNRSFLKDMFNRSTKVFEQYTVMKGKALTAQTLKVGCEFSKDIMSTIIDDLVALQADVKLFKDAMLSYIDSQDELRATTCTPTDGGYKADAEVVKLYSPVDVRKLVDFFVHEEDKQKKNILDMRSSIIDTISDGSNFSGLTTRYTDAETLQDVFNPICWQSAENRMNDYANEEKSQKLINVNILEKLSQEADWELFIERMCKDALVLVEKDGVETDADQILTSMVQLGLPKFENQAFRTKVEEKVRGIFNGEGYNNVSVYETSDSQLVVLTGKSSFPLRYVRTIKKLKECYDEFTKNDVCNYKIVHTESFTRPLPSLYNKSQEELKEELYRILLLVYCIPGIVDKETDTISGEQRDAIACKSNISGAVHCYNRLDFPDDMPSSLIFLGEDIRKSIDILSKRESDVTIMSELVDQQIAEKYKHNSMKQELTDVIKKFLKADVSNAYDGNSTDKELQKFVKAGDMIFEKELKQK